MRLTPHFTHEEFSSVYKGKVNPYPIKWIDERLWPLLKDLEKIREAIKRPIIVTSGYRTQKHNRAVGGSHKSYHLKGLAVDIKAYNKPTGDRVTPKKIYDKIEELIASKEISEGGLGYYSTHIHYDHRGHKARWHYKGRLYVFNK